MNIVEEASWDLIRKIDRWSQDELQFPRLLDEIRANIEFTNRQKQELCISMDLEWEDIEEIFDRASTRFEKAKEKL